jgi:hypothetical protein
MSGDYVKQLEATVEELKSKLEICVRENEQYFDKCMNMEKYYPKMTPSLKGFLFSVNKAVIAYLQEEKNGDKIVGYILFIKEKRICTVANHDDGYRIVQEWLDTGYDGIPLGG